jgi:hypothetical protein
MNERSNTNYLNTVIGTLETAIEILDKAAVLPEMEKNELQEFVGVMLKNLVSGHTTEGAGQNQDAANTQNTTKTTTS